jgi:hypothetical protein
MVGHPHPGNDDERQREGHQFGDAANEFGIQAAGRDAYGKFEVQSQERQRDGKHGIAEEHHAFKRD